MSGPNSNEKINVKAKAVTDDPTGSLETISAVQEVIDALDTQVETGRTRFVSTYTLNSSFSNTTTLMSKEEQARITYTMAFNLILSILLLALLDLYWKSIRKSNFTIQHRYNHQCYPKFIKPSSRYFI